MFLVYMNKINDSLMKEKHNLIRSYERKETDEIEYSSRLKELNKQIDERTQDRIKTQMEQ